jgi:transcriptional regulator with XRE-family HTH domain
VQQSTPLARTLRELRRQRGLTLRQVEERTGREVSNVYLSQLENGRRRDPGPRVLAALARAYDVPVSFLFEQAGYVDAPSPSALDVAFAQVLADPRFRFGTRLPGELTPEVKRVIVELYEQATGKRLLGASPDQTEAGTPGGQD